MGFQTSKTPVIVRTRQRHSENGFVIRKAEKLKSKIILKYFSILGSVKGHCTNQ